MYKKLFSLMIISSLFVCPVTWVTARPRHQPRTVEPEVKREVEAETLRCKPYPGEKVVFLTRDELATSCKLPIEVMGDEAGLCKVASVQDMGTVGQCHYVGVVYEFDGVNNASAVFVRAPKDKSYHLLKLALDGMSRFHEPEIIKTASGPILSMEASHGQALFNYSIYYIQEHGIWYSIDGLLTLNARFPKELEGCWFGNVFPDFKTMTFIQWAYTKYEDEQERCKKTARVHFLIKNRAFVQGKTEWLEE